MGHVPNTNKNSKRVWRTMEVIVVIILITGCTADLAIKRKMVQTTESRSGKHAALLASYLERKRIDVTEEMLLTNEVVSVAEKEEQYIEFENLFREHQDDIKKTAEELLSQDILDKEDFYMILFDEKRYWNIQWSDPTGNEFLYGNETFRSEKNEEAVKILNADDTLKETLNSIIEKGVITNIAKAYILDSIWVIDFSVDTKYTPFITGNHGVENSFVYCEDEGCEIYGYRKVEDNWYLRITPEPAE